MTSSNILSAWTKVELFPHHFEKILNWLLHQKKKRFHIFSENSVIVIDLNNNFVTMLVSFNKIVEMNDYIARYKINFNDVEVVDELINAIKQVLANCYVYKKFNKNLIKAKRFKTKHVDRRKDQIITITIFNDRIYETMKMKTQMKTEWQTLYRLELNIFKHIVVQQRVIDIINKKIDKQKQQITKKTIKKYDVICMTFRKLTSNIFFDVMSNPTKNSRKNVNVLNDLQLSPSRSLFTKSSLSLSLKFLSNVLSKKISFKKIEQRRSQMISLKKVKKISTIIRINRIDRIIKSFKR